jgi:glucosamine--fructose-6-phosphate aminotransferase (isomerizing)
MCGIVAYVGMRQASSVLLHGLERLEYRGYDSAGIAVSDGDRLQIRRAVGKLHKLKALVSQQTVVGSCGIGHTRWATHGGVSEINAHPHCDQSGQIVVVQNGIVENYRELKAELEAQGHRFRSQTDTEVIAHLLGRYYQTSGDLLAALCETAKRLEGGNAIVALSRREPERIVALRLGHAGGIIIGLGQNEQFLASDLSAIASYSQDLLFLDDGECALLTPQGCRIQSIDGRPIEKQVSQIAWRSEELSKGQFRHFMQKEIFEQPTTLRAVLEGRIEAAAGRVVLDELKLSAQQLRQLQQITITACGSAWHAGLLAKMMIEQFARIPVEIDYASEFRYRQPLLGKQQLMLVFSQSGETVDSLAAMQEACRQACPSLAIVNAPGSQAARLADAGAILLRAGPEIGVASTKAFTSMLMAAYLFALRLAELRSRLTATELQCHLEALCALPEQAELVLKQCASQVEVLAAEYAHVQSALFLGRQASYPIALEGALKLKEISYIHAQGYPAGEMKHGPVALIEEGTPVICIAPQDAIYPKMLSNIEQVKARGGRVIAIGNPHDHELARKSDALIEVPRSLTLLQPVLTVLPLQYFAYCVALQRGCDVDQPRNLAKSVTVE